MELLGSQDWLGGRRMADIPFLLVCKWSLVQLGTGLDK